MSYIITSENELFKTVAPNLPLAGEEYTRLYQEQLNNVLRLYFNRIDKLMSQLNATAPLNTITFTVYTVVTLPSAVTSGAGAVAFVSDALAPVFGNTVVSGGSVKVPVYSDGTNWKVG
jgi:hypothetical protein